MILSFHACSILPLCLSTLCYPYDYYPYPYRSDPGPLLSKAVNLVWGTSLVLLILMRPNKWERWLCPGVVPLPAGLEVQTRNRLCWFLIVNCVLFSVTLVLRPSAASTSCSVLEPWADRSHKGQPSVRSSKGSSSMCVRSRVATPCGYYYMQLHFKAAMWRRW